MANRVANGDHAADAIAFFPRDPTFWRNHALALLFPTVTTAASSLLWGRGIGQDLVTALLWAGPFTGSILLFRTLYWRRHWNDVTIAMLTVRILIFAALSGIVIAACVAALAMPLFRESFAAAFSGSSQASQLFVLRYVIGNGLQFQLFVSAWAFVYISASHRDKVRMIALTNLQLQNSLKESQLKILTNQLNPHFLFNALNNIRFLTHESVDNADAAILALSELLRYSLHSNQAEKVALSQEISCIERYVAIVKVQYEARLIFTLEIPEPLKACLVPPLLLQGLVENGVKHGIDHLRQGGRLSLLVSENEGKLRIVVTNDMPDHVGQPPDGTGLSLINLRERLGLIYGGAATLTTAKTERRFTVTLILPSERAT